MCTSVCLRGQQRRRLSVCLRLYEVLGVWGKGPVGEERGGKACLIEFVQLGKA